METFVGDIVRIKLITDVDVSSMDVVGIKFERSDGTKGYWPADVDLLDHTAIYYDTDDNDLNISGKWQLQAYAEETGVSKSHGRVVNLYVHDPLTNRLTETTLAPTTVVPTTFIP